MEKQEINGDSTSSRRLLPLLYPGSLTTTSNVPPAGNSHHNPSQHAAAHFASRAGPGYKPRSSSYEQPPSTHASAGVGGICNSNTVSPDIVSGSGWAAGSSSYQMPPSPPLPPTHYSSGGNSGGVVDGGSSAGDTSNGTFSVSSFFQMSPAPVPMDTNPTLGRGHASFFSSPGTGLAPLTCTQAKPPPSENSLPAPVLTQSMASFDSGLLPPLHPTLAAAGTPPMQMQTSTGVNPEAVQYVDLEGPGGHLNSSGRDWGSTSTTPLPYSSSITQAPWAPLSLTPSSSMPAPGANFGVKKEAVDWSWGTPQLGKNTMAITSGGSSSAWMPQPYSSGSTNLMVVGSKRKQMNPPVVAGFADGLFTQDDIGKIMADKVLKVTVLKNPERVRGILRNRSASERARQKTIRHVSDLEGQAVLLQEENKLLSAQMHSLQSEAIGLKAEKNEIMIKLSGSQHDTLKKKALNETLNDEVLRLKLVVGGIRGSPMSNSSYQERIPQTMPADHPKKHNRQLAQLQQEQELQEFENFITQ